LALAEGYLAIQAERDVLKAQQEAIGEVMKDLPWNCAACRHQHTGRRLGNICIGCPCEQRTPEAQD
jgi:hypothetical protein